MKGFSSTVHGSRHEAKEQRMQGASMSVSDKLPLRKRIAIGTVDDELEDILLRCVRLGL
ncbi:MAG: hypothetical protein ILA04_03040 [Prevotella sp.]|nr:hypothetical protein [Prevotella sp.]